MLCVKCGKDIDGAERFCSSCGTQIEKTNSSNKGSSSSTKPFSYKIGAIFGNAPDKISAVIGIVLILLTLLPWAKITYAGYTIEFTLIEIYNMWHGITNILPLEYSAMYLPSTLFFFAMSWASVVLIILMTFFCIRTFLGKKTSPVAFLVLGICSAIFIIVMYVIDFSATASASSSLELFGTTFWPWIVALVSFSTFFAYRYTVKKRL